MFAISSGSRFFLYTAPADMHRGFDRRKPFAYLNDVLSRIATHPYKQLAALLPQN